MKNEYSIQFISNVTGINPHTLRAWEKRYSIVTPKRLDNGRRVYTEQMLEKLSLLQELVLKGHKISELSEYEIPQLKELKDKFGSKKFLEKNDEDNEILDIHGLLQNLILALNNFKLDIISHELGKAKGKLDLREFSLSLISPLMVEIGKLCGTGRLTVAQEHAISAVIKFHIGEILFKNLNTKPRYDEKILIAAPEGELHEFGLLISCLLCIHYKVSFLYLGPNMPADSVAQCAEQIKAKKVILGISQNMLINDAQVAEYYVYKLADLLEGKSQFWVGGFAPKKNIFGNDVSFFPTLLSLDMALNQSFR